MPEPGFERIDNSDQCLFGPRKLLVCGFASEDQSKLPMLTEMLKIAAIPLVWVQETCLREKVGELVNLPDGWGAGQSSPLPRAIIVSGISQKELHQLMTGCRTVGIKPALWAALTPTSAGWHLQKLLQALSAEHRVMSARMARPPKQPISAED